MPDLTDDTTDDTTLDLASMSDEQISDMSIEDMLAATAGGDAETNVDTTDATADTDDGDPAADGTDIDPDAEETDDDAEDTDTDDLADDVDDKEVDKKGESSSSDIDFEAEHTKLLTPFKANGKQIQVDSVEDAQRLMQMGANYHSKMASLKPARKIAKLLENNGLLDEAKINFLIDLHNQNPDAITQLLKDAKIDPTAVDMDTDSGYQPQARTVGDNELVLDDVLASIKDTDTYDKTLRLVTQDWDDESRNILVQNPSYLELFNEHMGNGIYDQVTSLVEQQRQLGKLTGVSDIKAYKLVGDKLHQQGQLITQTSSEQTKTDAILPAKSKDKPTKASTNRRNKAAVKRSAPKKTTKKAVSIYSMSDAEVAKLDAPPFKYV